MLDTNPVCLRENVMAHMCMAHNCVWLTFDLSCLIELLIFQELYNKAITKFEN